MIIVLRQDASPREIKNLQDSLRARGTVTTVIRGEERSVIAVIGAIQFSGDELENDPAVLEVLHVSKPYKLASRESGLTPRIQIGDCLVGGPQFIVMAGPCAVENRETLLESAVKLSEMGVNVLRGGAFKPRTSPYSFQGLGEEGLQCLAEAREATGMLIITECMDARDAELVHRYTDIFQIGARNMQNFTLLKEVGAQEKPVMLKRGMSATIKDLLMSAEYVMAHGNHQVLLCERGIRTFETETRNTLDLSAVPVLQALSHLPVVVDPSHGAGVWEYVAPMARGGMAVGADALMIEVHPRPEEAKSDGPQALIPSRFKDLMNELRDIAQAVGRTI